MSRHPSPVKPSKKPRVVAMLGQKGGSGKTTIAVHLAVAAQQDGERVGIIDTDPQASAHSWVGFREHQDPPVALVSPAEIDRVIAIAQEKGVSLIVIDTAPHATPGAYQAIARADLILLPCRPTIVDLAAIHRAVAIAEASKRPSAFILNACAPRAPEVVSARETLVSYEIPVSPTVIGQRQAYARAMASGQAVTEFEPEGQAAAEIRQLWNWIKEQFPYEQEADRI
jgi:chromosome partitioning protein